MKPKKYKVELEVSTKRIMYVKAHNKSEACFLARCDFNKLVEQCPWVIDGKLISSKVKSATVVPPSSEAFNIFGDDYGN